MTSYNAIERLKLKPTAEALRAEALSPHTDILQSLERVYVYGAGQTGARVHRSCHAAGLNVLAYVDANQDKQAKGCNGIGVVSPQEAAADRSATIVVASVVHFSSMTRTLAELHADRVVFYPLLTLFDSARFPPEVVFDGLDEDLAAHADEYVSLFDRLADDTSRKVLDSILSFRLTLDEKYCRAALCRGHAHYFPPGIIELGRKEVFVDGGGYDGDSTQNFAQQTDGQFQAVHLFEPDPELIAKAKTRLAGYDRITFHEKALYNDEVELRFSPDGIAGTLATDGALRVQATTIDRAVSEKATYIKLDLEGAEPEAIEGGATQIEEHRPRLAISAYHEPAHLWCLEKQITELRSDYKLFARHYSNGVADTVLYFV